jgi:hypothetical protein
MSEQKHFTASIRCGHCQNQAPMEIVSEYSAVQSQTDERSNVSWEAGPVHELDKCPACDGLTLRRYYYHDAMDPSDVECVVLYPLVERVLRGLPRKIDAGYQAAQKVRNIDANAYGILLGRVLDLCAKIGKRPGTRLTRGSGVSPIGTRSRQSWWMLPPA